MKYRVPVLGTIGKSIELNPEATQGATVGLDLRWPDGAIVKESDLRAASAAAAPSSGTPPSGGTPVAWALILLIPANVVAVQNLATSGAVVRKADGSWTTRVLTGTAGRIAVADGDGNAGNPAIDLAPLADSGAGELLAIERDAFGRVAGTRPATYLHVQTAPAGAWTIPHNLGHEPIISIYTAGGAVIEADVVHLSANVASISLSSPLAGYARCI